MIYQFSDFHDQLKHRKFTESVLSSPPPKKKPISVPEKALEIEGR